MLEREAAVRWSKQLTVALLFSGALWFSCWTYWNQVWPPGVLVTEPTAHMDGTYYYAILHTLGFDSDFDFTNQYAVLGDPWGKWTRAPESGRPGNMFTIGPALFWSPFFAWARLFGPGGDGSGTRFQLLVFFGSCVWGWASALVTYGIARRAYSRLDAVMAALAALFGTPLFWYMTRQACYSHAVSAFTTAFLLWVWIRGHGSWALVRWLSVGVACGLGMSVRPGAMAHAFVPATELVPGLFAALRAKDRAAIVQRSLAGLGFAVGVLIGFFPQMFMWKSLYGVWWTVPQGDHFLLWAGSRYVATLFSTWQGWAAWHPIVSLGIVGLLIAAIRGSLPLAMRRVAVGGLFAIALQAYLNGATQDWYGGWAFGGRRFTDLTPYIALGVAQMFSLLGDRELQAYLSRAARVAVPSFAALAFGYFSSDLAQHYLVSELIDHPSELLKPWKSAVARAMDGVYAVTGNWGSIPMNWWFASAGNVSPERFDISGAYEPFQFESVVWPFRERWVALGGFGDEVQFGGQPCRWLAAPEGRFTFTMRNRYELHASLAVAANVPGTRLRLSLEGQTLFDSELSTTMTTYEFDIPKQLVVTGSNFVRVEQFVPPPTEHEIGSTGVKLTHDVSARSAGWGVGMAASLAIDGRALAAGKRGISLYTLEPETAAAELVGSYDTFVSKHAADALADAVADLKPGTIAALVVADEASTYFSPRGDEAIRSLGGKASLVGAFRASYALIGVKGAVPGSAQESFSLTSAVAATLGRSPARALPGTVWHTITLSRRRPAG